MNLTTAQLHTLRHMLGINDPSVKVPRPSRNYAAVNPGDPDFRTLESLGAVICYRRADVASCYDWFKCTDAGTLAAMRSFRTIRKPKPARVYGRFLDAKDAFGDLTFHKFLTDPYFDEARRNA